MKRVPLLVSAGLLAVSAGVSLWAVRAAARDEEKEPDVPYVPTPHKVVDRMLELAKVKKGDVVYDLGCGDGRIVIAAAKRYRCKAVGFDIDPERVKDSEANRARLDRETQKLVSFKKQDVFTLDLSRATVVALYLLPDLNVKLVPQLEKMRPGSRIVSHDFDMAGVIPDKVVKVNAGDREHTLYLWTVPLKKEKR
jgi:ribosomal protein L11 methylase PrmA